MAVTIDPRRQATRNPVDPVQQKVADIAARARATTQRVTAPPINVVENDPDAVAAYQARNAQPITRADMAANSENTAYGRRTGTPTTISPADLTDSERASFARQSPNFNAQVASGAAPGVEPAGTSAAANAAPAAEAAATPSIASGVSRLGQVARAGGAALGAVTEGARVLDAGVRGGYAGARDEVGNSAARLTAANVGARLGSQLPGPPIVKGAGAVLGGAAGYYAGDKGMQAARGIGDRLLDSASDVSGVDRDKLALGARALTLSPTDLVTGPTAALADRLGLSPEKVGARLAQAINAPRVVVNPDAARLERDGALRQPNPPGTAYGPPGSLQAPPQVIDASQGGGPPTIADDATAALNSNRPGTAVINGRVVGKDEIAQLANRNVVSNVGNPASGVAFSEATGGKTLALGDGIQSQGGFTAGDRAQQLNSIERRGRDAQLDRLTKLSETALAGGKRRTAEILGRLAESYKNSQQAPEDPSLQVASRRKANAEAGLAESNLATAGEAAAARKKTASIIDQIGATTDAGKRGALIEQVAAAQGRNIDDPVKIIKVTSGDLDANGMPIHDELPFDTRTQRLLYQPERKKPEPDKKK